MDITLNAKIKRVGNSLAFFIPVGARRKLSLMPNEEIVAVISKKRKKDAARLLFGALRGRKIIFGEEDRLDARQ